MFDAAKKSPVEINGRAFFIYNLRLGVTATRHSHKVEDFSSSLKVATMNTGCECAGVGESGQAVNLLLTRLSWFKSSHSHNGELAEQVMHKFAKLRLSPS